jgi:protein disulfide-isomerase-like protein
MMNVLKDFDFYRRIPKDLTESSTHGSALSICAAIFMLILFVLELSAFLSPQYQTNVLIDSASTSQLRINFNITLLDMPCEYATIDVVDVLGTRTQNVTKNINTWQVDDAGNRMRYEGRNIEQREVAHDTHHELDKLLANGLHALPMDDAKFEDWLKEHHYTFVNFYAPWCIWCQRLEPVWEAFAERIEAEKLPVSIIKVDCMANQNTCMKQKVQAFPTVRLFKDSVGQNPDYKDSRTVEDFTTYIRDHISTDERVKQLPQSEQDQHFAELESNKDHPGCMLSGFLMVNRVPGNFHIEARSINHNLNPKAANLSHVISHLSFGPPANSIVRRKLETVPKEYFDLESTQPMNGNVYINLKQHQAFHHYAKVCIL